MPSFTVRDICTLYLRHSEATGLHGPAALVERIYTLRWFADDFGDWLVSDCKAFHLQDWIESHPCWKSPATRRQKANCVRAAFSWAVRTERIDRNPFAHVRYAEAERRAEMPDELIDRIVGLGSSQFGSVVRFLRLTGCRVGEVVEANWADVDLGAGTWTIQRHKTRKFTGREKVVALVPEAVALLAECSAAARGTGPGVSGPMLSESVSADAKPLFVAPRGCRWNRHTLSQAFRRIVKRHKIATTASLHGIRHRAASAAIGAGASVKLVAEQLGHSSTAITEAYYFHRGPEHLAAMRDAMRRGLKNGE